mgnify:CR=1
MRYGFRSLFTVIKIKKTHAIFEMVPSTLQFWLTYEWSAFNCETEHSLFKALYASPPVGIRPLKPAGSDISLS